MKKGDKVQILKISEVAGTQFPAADNREWIQGGFNGKLHKSLPIAYTLKGILLNDIVVGEQVQVDRTERNGVKEVGSFVTSPVMKVTECGFATQNSVYLIEQLDKL